MGRFSSLIKKANIRVVVSSAVALGLLSYVVSFIGSPQKLSSAWIVFQNAWYKILLLTFPYLLGRFFVWRSFLEELDIRINFKNVLFSFLVGEMTKSLPMGIYFESFLLNRFNNVKQTKVQSYLATTAMLGTESIISVPIVLFEGVPGFHWLRWSTTGAVIFWILFLSLVWFVATHKIFPGRISSKIKEGKELILEFFKGSKRLLNFKTLALLIPTFIYILSYTGSLYFAVSALGFSSISFWNTLSVFAFFNIATILIPIPTELGLVEITGLEALVAFGVSTYQAAIIMVSLRVISTAAIFLIAGSILFFMKGQFAKLNGALTR